MANVLIGATGSVAAVRVPALHEALVAAGNSVKIVATEAAVYFFDPASLPPGTVIRDADEWPGKRYQRDDPVVHVELRKWADAFVLAPLDANTLAKIAVGLCDNCLTCVWRAWDTAKPVILAPAMNAFMWQHPFTRRHLRAIAADCGAAHVPGHLDDTALFAQINDRSKTLRIVAPVEKRLACGDTGMGGLAEVADIAQAVAEILQRSAPAV
ncbi:MAG TPA: flavoprotein [Gemmataceae bacterium]|jgi:phosphopantothenoylcysteine decarboxylase